MSRMLKLAICSAVLCNWTSLPGNAAGGRKAGVQRTASSDKQRGGQTRLPRPKSNNMRVTEVSEKMMRVLKNWENASGDIKTLEGEHYRHIYDSVWFTETVSRGRFFYEAPDKGRIDFREVNTKDQTSKRFNPKTKKPYKKQSEQPESWICDGARVFQLNHTDKTGDVIAIPEEAQGKNIMDGPLPFLFGMPADMAKQRYELEFAQVKNKGKLKDAIWLNIKPRWQQDAINWSSATVILNHKTYLPIFVRMIDPSENLETVYGFKNLIPNKFAFPWKNPFSPPKGYKLNLQGPQSPVPQPSVPSTIGLTAKNARDLLKKSGYKINWVLGVPAKNKSLTYVVYQQSPGPRVQVPKGGAVKLTYYAKFGTRNNGKPVTR